MEAIVRESSLANLLRTYTSQRRMCSPGRIIVLLCLGRIHGLQPLTLSKYLWIHFSTMNIYGDIHDITNTSFFPATDTETNESDD
ncbi:16134_t:CDS:2 [Funneliformis caledonium]|uniref:16134_t:CDS:1 n=1 Tax=Funneliformis caledonium TaxID=1117310 RepID=A0A9N9CX25_9GLOM|nr:16134_t:CDS:2 [Funneliformis caledonium]